MGGGDTQQIATGGRTDLLGYPPFLFSYKLLFITDQCIDVLSLCVMLRISADKTASSYEYKQKIANSWL